jgi:2'-5' RNA ligase
LKKAVILSDKTGSVKNGRSMPETIRAFIAIEPPALLAAHLGRLQEKLKASGLKIGWVRPANIHLTVRFLGDIPAADVEKIRQALAEPLWQLAPVKISLKGLGTFPGGGRPRVVWAGTGEGREALGVLKQLVEERLAGCGYERETRPFRAHLTLGRIRGAVSSTALTQAIDAFGDFETPAETVDRVTFYKSDLKPQGAVYTRLAEFRLGAGAAETVR